MAVKWYRVEVHLDDELIEAKQFDTFVAANEYCEEMNAENPRRDVQLWTREL